MTCRVSRLVVVQVVVMAQALEAQDTVRVRADGPPKWGAVVGLVQEVAIGALDGPPEYAFGRIESAAMETSGGFYLFDLNDRQIRRYDRTGRFLNLVGKKGGGPGEYEYAHGMAVTRDGRLIVHDPQNSRITYFYPDGKVASDFPLLRAGFYGTNFVIDTSGRIYQTVAYPGRAAEGPGSRQQYLRLTPEGAVVDSLLLPERKVDMTGPGRSFMLSTSDGGRWNFVERSHQAPFPPGGYLSGSSNAYRFVVTRPGQPVYVVERRYEPVPLGDAERNEWLQWATWFETNRAGFKYLIPRTKPAIRALTGDHLGRVWVHVFGPAEKRNEPPRPPGDNRPLLTWKERNRFDVFSLAGEYLGRVTLPPETVLLAIRDNRILTRGKGPDGEDRVIIYRLDVPDRM